MDEEMEDAAEESSFGFEVDVDYEFDAPRYFHLAVEEPRAEARDAERWFDTAGSYPPSPLIAKIYLEDHVTFASFKSIPVPNVEGNAKPNDCMPGFCISEDLLKADTKLSTKGPFSMGSTLMKPTASYLAKQTKRHEVKSAARGNKPATVSKPIAVKGEEYLEDIKDCTYQSAKRQRLERGHLCKAVGGVQSDLIHKVREMNTGHAGCDSELPKLKITIPREPVLETKRRAERPRIQRFTGSDNVKQSQEANKPSSSKHIHPFNRKVGARESPFPLPQKITAHLMNSRPDVQPAAIKGAFMSSKGTEHKIYLRLRPQAQVKEINTKNPEEGRLNSLSFKARPLDKKILSFKGDAGVFRSTKQQTTVPKEFNLSTSKRSQHAPLSELFNKLSLVNEARHAPATQAAFSLPIHVTTKDSKENVNSRLHC